MYYKNVKAFEYILHNYKFDFILRTNLSSFFNMDNVFEYVESLPLQSFAGGLGCGNFISGTCMVFSKDVAKLLTQDVRQTTIYEDVNISQIISDNHIQLQGMTRYVAPFLIDNWFNPNVEIPHNVLFYRIKNCEDRNIDIMYFKLLLKKIYDIMIE